MSAIGSALGKGIGGLNFGGGGGGGLGSLGVSDFSKSAYNNYDFTGMF